jgi:hypothetical protein
MIPLLTVLNIFFACVSLIKNNRRNLSIFFLLFSVSMLLSIFYPFSDYLWFILPTRLFPFLLLFNFIMVLTYINDFDILGRLINKIPARTFHKWHFNHTNMTCASKVIFSLVLIIGFFFWPIISHITLEQAKHWGFPNFEFHKNYGLFLWLHHNTNSSDLLMTDYSFNTQFLNSFSIKNMTATFWPNTPSDVTRAYDGQIAWERPGLMKDFIRKYDVKYIVVISDPWGYLDPAPLGGDNLLYRMPFTTDEYNGILSHMPFLKLVKKVGSSSVYKVV